MFYKQWEILLVDDEPDVLSVSTLAMRSFEVYGLPVRIFTAGSKAEAIELLNSRPDIRWSLAVAFIDVVMETDTAGLELCDFIRNDMGNRLTQLFIRTGQPEVAPERQVIDQYDINGYFTKVETTEAKLYTLVKSGVRQCFWSIYSLATIDMMDAVVTLADSREKIAKRIKGITGEWAAGAETVYHPPLRLVMGDMVISQGGDQAQVSEILNKLMQLEGQSLSPQGDKYVRDEGGNQLFYIAGQPSVAETYWVFKMAFIPPDFMTNMAYKMLRTVAHLWVTAQ
jgi:CheY-like chemotaxis protein